MIGTATKLIAMEDERRHRMEDRERVKQVLRDGIRGGTVKTWRRDDVRNETLWERIKRTVKKVLQ